VHIPYHVTWHHELVPDESMPPEGWVRIESIAELSRTLADL
jgi:hypothetical protein